MILKVITLRANKQALKKPVIVDNSTKITKQIAVKLYNCETYFSTLWELFKFTC